MIVTISTFSPLPHDVCVCVQLVEATLRTDGSLFTVFRVKYYTVWYIHVCAHLQMLLVGIGMIVTISTFYPLPHDVCVCVCSWSRLP